MKMDNYLDCFFDEDIISKIYRNEFELAAQLPKTIEYEEIRQYTKKQEKELLKYEGFKKYLEIRNIKDSMEAEQQFKLGFKIAVKVIIESYHS